MFERLTVNDFEALADKGLFAFAHCGFCDGVRPVQPFDVPSGLLATCGVCKRDISVSTLRFVDRAAAKAEYGWQIDEMDDDRPPLVN